VIEMNWDAFAGKGIVHEGEPFDDVAFDAVGEVVYGVGAVGEAEVDDGAGAGVGARVAPEEIGGVQIVVGPERGERGEQRMEFGVEGGEELECAFGVAQGLQVLRDGRAGGEVLSESGGGSG